MRVAWNDDEVREGFKLSSEEAAASFGDDRLLIERFIDNPRHVEIQILADSQGNCIYLNERECSIQRRNQKVVEEAPSPFITPEVRKAMGEQAVLLSQAVNYQSAGTVEFLVDTQMNFYFLEMNTRLQVEHPITECITGVDIVDEMLRVAAGYPLSYTQSDIGIKGWAMECRVYAEDPVRYLPSIGLLTKYTEPGVSHNTAELGVRCDSGIVEGSSISIHYDPMISKLVTYAPTRQEAIDHMEKALDEYVIDGITHNTPLLREILGNERFKSGDISTKFLEEEYPQGYSGGDLTSEQKGELIPSLSVLHHMKMNRAVTDGRFEYIISCDEDKVPVTVNVQKGDYTVTFEDTTVTVHPSGGVFGALQEFELNSANTVALQHLHFDGVTHTLRYRCCKRQITVLTPLQQRFMDTMPVKVKEDTSNLLISPMPGSLSSISVEEGDEVLEGTEVAVVVAMKMNNSLKAPKSGKIKKIWASVGDVVEGDQKILEFY